MKADSCNRYDWLQKEIDLVPRKKFHLSEPKRSADLGAIENRYGPLPSDYREFAQQFGSARLFRNSRSQWYNLMVFVPPEPIEEDPPVRIRVGHHADTGEAWLEWKDGALVSGGAIYTGFFPRRRRAAPCFEEWLRRSVASCKKFYSREEWAALCRPAAPFNDRELQVVDAIPKFTFKKVGVTDSGKVRIEITNGSPITLPYLTVGVRERRMEGAIALPTLDISPGCKKTIEKAMYSSMDPACLELFSLSLPDIEDRAYFRELDHAKVGQTGSSSDT